MQSSFFPSIPLARLSELIILYSILTPDSYDSELLVALTSFGRSTLGLLRDELDERQDGGLNRIGLKQAKPSSP
ncbi:unnamed protein product [Protopolystoma xenopodis]|uniref:Uncharacterized protein n=1 Tax=Protopolystoma xenopodis TaxID=117903 RepID=A0A448XCL3_9PLAT|nr:unnamed protein product [Protopolystoma xenopodis]